MKKVKVMEGKIEVGVKEHYKPAITLYVHPELITNENGQEVVVFPLHADIYEEKALIPSSEYFVFIVEVESGFRGGAELNIVSEYEKLVYFPIYKSERGSIGIGKGAIVVVKEPVVIYEWRRSGRLYGEPSFGLTIQTLTEEKVYPHLNYEDYLKLKALGVLQ